MQKFRQSDADLQDKWTDVEWRRFHRSRDAQKI